MNANNNTHQETAPLPPDTRKTPWNFASLAQRHKPAQTSQNLRSTLSGTLLDVTENYPEALATNASPTARTAIVVLGAGSGTRLKEKMPKAAVDVHGKPCCTGRLSARVPRVLRNVSLQRFRLTAHTGARNYWPMLLNLMLSLRKAATPAPHRSSPPSMRSPPKTHPSSGCLSHDCARVYASPGFPHGLR